MSAKAMDFITLHRVTNHPTDWMWTEIYARKIKDTDLGGQVTPADKPFKMKMVNKVGFEDEFRIAGYRIDKVSCRGDIKAGCHRIAFEEVEYIVKKLNWK